MNSEIEALLQNLDKLNSKTRPQWGTMTAQKMLEHLGNTFKIASGKMTVECFSDEKKLPVLKKILLSDRPMPKSFDSPANRLIPQNYEYTDMEEAKSVLRNEVDNYYKVYEENPDASFINPTFGKLNKVEWDQFHKKHLTHHLTQFGLLE